jgi:hypothetical protein
LHFNFLKLYTENMSDDEGDAATPAEDATQTEQEPEQEQSPRKADSGDDDLEYDSDDPDIQPLSRIELVNKKLRADAEANGASLALLQDECAYLRKALERSTAADERRAHADGTMLVSADRPRVPLFELPWWAECSGFKDIWRNTPRCTINPKINEDRLDTEPMARVRKETAQFYSDLIAGEWLFPGEVNGAFFKIPAEVHIKLYEVAVNEPYMLPWNTMDYMNKVSFFIVFLLFSVLVSMLAVFVRTVF